MTISYPQFPSALESVAGLDCIKTNWEYSKNKLTDLNAEFNQVFKGRDFSIALAGSFGRMEANTESDLDYIIIPSKGELADKEQIKESISSTASKFGIQQPNSKGVFSVTYTAEQLTDGFGNSEDNLKRLGQRMLLLMEARPVFNQETFDSTIDKLLAAYLKLIIKQPQKEAVLLLNDLIRYFRSIAIDYHHTSGTDKDRWAIRNIKLRHSRVFIYSGLLFLIANASKIQENKYDYFRNHVSKTPIERMIHVYSDNEDNCSDLLRCYNVFLEKISDKKVRDGLLADYDRRYENPIYKELKENSDKFITELTRFIFLQKDKKWSSRFFEYLIF